MDNFEDDFPELYEDDKTQFVEIEEKPKFLSKILNFVSKYKGVENSHNEYKDYSVFEHIANNVDTKDLTRENHLNVREAVTLSEEAMKLFNQKLVFLDRSKSNNDKISKMEIFNKLNDQELEYFKMILGRYESLVKEKNVIDAQLSSFNKNVVHLSSIIDDANENINKIAEAEKTHRIFRQDINHIEGEKQELLDEMEQLIIARDFFSKFSMAFIFISVVFAIGLSFVGIFYEADIFMQLFILIITVMIVGTFIAVTRINISKRMRLNIAFQKRAVSLLNKKNAVYAYYTNYLNFEYNKYRVKTSNELKSNIKEVDFYKQTLRRYNNVRAVVRESEIEIYEFLDEHKINSLRMSLLQFAKEVNIDEQMTFYKNLTIEKDKIDTILFELDEKYDLVISKLNTLSDNDNTSTKVVSKIVNQYYDEIERVVSEYK